MARKTALPVHSKREPLIDLKGAGVYRDGRWLVRNVDLTIHRGEIVTLIGPNGAGKSTTAKMALHILKPDEGEVHHIKGLRIGYVPQKINIDRTMPLSVERLMTLTGPLPKADIVRALDAVGITHLLKAEITNLSGGEFQRALMARALARKPDIMVLDEPVQGVDFSGEAALYELIAKLRDDTGCGVLLISHDLHLVMAATDRVICLNGHVCCSGTPRDVTASPEYLRLFGSRAVGPLAVYEHHHDHTHLPDGRVMHADGTVTDHCHAEDGHHHDGEHHHHHEEGKPHA
ncbi:metal ABC transporter ATP-binding protein [Ochrobactrum sp. MYb15]|uniref:ATP-binding cassette domain-containing protein n=1 Tax=Brucella TaxID=234 RepID=UPI00046433B6|nr:metal ABC transporter ATP-binding protein [Brucella rhizosphaerae]PQZ48017.1 metal ABC transporter ATP-binding protein [Ochrobactrum sp. MYb19]PRA64202.1 metal ABC transporter ATP-binding protein [Ochrobactrum sp. MYb18]PRA75289.1 metal ABC transporter ATP-binding protein [Brucella thiophenivorans]PRA89501.1 metal ABC transporter ATP-binding protein [Ochrobactrum sp. MYb14]PRA96530.1 metal ABC transporter ATP-binding protein [Ochrobactrum sp. MYb15]